MARQIGTDRMVAIKTFAFEYFQNPEAALRFRQEMRDTAVPEKSGIIPILDADETNDFLYVVSEHVDGYTIAQYLADHGPLAEKTALEIALQVAIGLDEAWKKLSIMHGDLKPENILIDRKDGTVRLADFGVVSALNRACGEFAPDFFAGTPNYASPEQAGGERNLDCGTDIYALGATLYQMATGCIPFGNTGHEATLKSQRLDYLRDPLDLRPALSPEIGSLIEVLMVKDRTARHAQWSQAIEDLQNALKGFRPASGLPPQGASTVMRGEVRLFDPGALPRVEAPEPPKPSPTRSVEAPPAAVVATDPAAGAPSAEPAQPVAVSPAETPAAKPKATASVQKVPAAVAGSKPKATAPGAKKRAIAEKSLGLQEGALRALALGFITAAIFVLARNPVNPKLATARAAATGTGGVSQTKGSLPQAGSQATPDATANPAPTEIAAPAIPAASGSADGP